jgi:hypothetical protein
MEPIMGLSLTGIVAIGGLVGAIASVGLLAWQTRAVAQQAKASNAISRAAVISNSSANLRQVSMLFFEQPELWPYFYESKNPPPCGDIRTQLIVLAEMLGDIFEDGLVVHRLVPTIRSYTDVAHRLVPTIRSYDDWVEYCSPVLTTSPVLKEIMEHHPDWWPRLRSLAPRTLGVETS